MNTPASADAAPHRINPWRLFTGAMIPNWLLCRPEVSAGAKLAYARLCQFSGRDGLCFPRQTTLAAELGVSDRAVRNYLRELEEFQLVEVDQPGLQQSNRYAFLAHPWINDGSGAAAGLPERQGCSAPDRNDSSGPDRQDSSGPYREMIHKEENHTHTHPAAAWVPPSLEEVLQTADLRAIPRDCAEKFFHDQTANEWRNRDGHPLRQWPAKLQGYAVSWRAVDHQRAAVTAVRSSAPPKRSGAFAAVAPAEAFTSNQI
jgi:hypothetical protein